VSEGAGDMSDRQVRWRRVETLLDRVLELSNDEVALILDEECAGDPELRSEIESLLEADRKAPQFLDGEAVDLLGTDIRRLGGSLEGERLGPWRVVHEIGRGGMSAVYLGERADGQYEQRVAIKVLRRDIASGELGRRFHRERQILATLEHPLIVRIQDGGITGDGRPYLVMDYIDGERIDRHCDRLRLSIAERLRLFIQVLDAVQFAHRNLIVHRDLKPANILISTDKRIRLLDFGIAKLLHNDEPSGEQETRTGIRAMTPEYASPEQIRGERVTTSSDVYALGVLLYELLTGHRPYVLAQSTPYAVERAICESEPERPSEAVGRTTGTADPTRPASTPETISQARSTVPAVLRSTLDGDLDAIVLKALRKDPADRYGSVDAFREDIDRYLGGHPVLARQGSRSYAIRKFVSRNRWPVTIATVIAILLVGSTILISIARSRTERERVRAEQAAVEARRESATADEVTTFLVELFGGSDPNETLGDSISARVLLERGRQRIQRELTDQPAVRASLLLAIGNVYSSLGRHEIADTLIRNATALRAELFGNQDEKVAESLEALAANLIVSRQTYEAHGVLTDALAIRRGIGGDQRSKIAGILAGLATTHQDTGKPDSAYALLQEAADLLRSAGDTAGLQYLNLRVDLASALRALNRYDEAELVYREVLPRQRELFGDRSPVVASTLNGLAFLVQRESRPDEAATLYREALEIESTIFGEDHPQTQMLMQNLASALIAGGHQDEGLEVLRTRLAAARSRWTDNDWRTASAASGLGRAYMTFDRYAEAEPLFRTAESSFTATIGRDHAWTVAVRAWIAGSIALRGRTREAGPLFDRNIDQLRAAVLDNDVRASLTQLARKLDGAGLTARAEAYRQIVKNSTS
jgi:eukaryotic-like serine/threonine-protein kinase